MSKINFKDKHIRYGGYGALLTLIVIAITIVLNIVVTNLNIKVDTTSEKIYSLTDTTKDMAKTIKDPIYIYVLEETDQETSWLKEILLKYTKLNSNIKVVYKDPVLYPTFGSSYLSKSNQNITKIDNSSLIVENETTGKFKIVPPTEFIQSTSDGSGSSQNAITVESAVTNAIGYVLNANDGNVYYTTGHKEYDLSTYFTNSCDRVNLSNKAINLLSDEMPDPATSAIVINSPHSDFTSEEVDKLIAFMNNGGKAMIFMDVDVPDLPEFNKLLNYYGVAHQTGLAVETNSKNMTSVYATFLLPNKGNHDILNNMASNTSTIVLPNSSGFEALSDARTSLKLTPLLTTSKDAFLRKDLSNSASTKQPGDIDGPITLAYAIEDSSTGTKDASGSLDTTKLVVIADSYGLSDNYVNVAATGNESFISNSLGWLLSVNTSYAIEAKTEDAYNLKALSTTSALLIDALIVIIIPLIVIILGIVVWVRRRHA